MPKYYECIKCGYNFEKDSKLMAATCPICNSPGKLLDLKPIKKWAHSETEIAAKNTVRVRKFSAWMQSLQSADREDSYTEYRRNWHLEIINKGV